MIIKIDLRIFMCTVSVLINLNVDLFPVVIKTLYSTIEDWYNCG
jgi:hypothetical protein